MSRNLEVEFDNLKQEMNELRQLLQEFITPKSEKTFPKENSNGSIQKMPNMHPDPAIMNILDRLENNSNDKGDTGSITYLGVFASGGRQSTWIRNEVSTDSLLALIENKLATKVLNCIGNNDRLNILLALLKKPMTVAQLVEQYGYNTTGQVYHHIKPLIAADLIREDEQSRGSYCVVPYRVQGIIMLLAGISDMLNPQYTEGRWEE